MRRLLLPVLIGLTVLPASLNPAVAQEKISFPGSGDTILNLAATERTVVTQDMLTATLRIEEESADATLVQGNINSRMKELLALAKAVTSVKTATGHYYVYQYTPPRPEPLSPPVDGTPHEKPEEPPAVWKGSQSLIIEGTDAQALLQLAGTLQQKGMIMDNLSYGLSPEKAEETKDSLMEAALSKVKAKADRAAKALGKNRAELIEITIDTEDMPAHPPVMMRAMAMDGAMEKGGTPSAEPGETDINLTISARALLK
ncbi:MAG: SIMPL domain-containing protein [Micavibrio sp.]